MKQDNQPQEQDASKRATTPPHSDTKDNREIEEELKLIVGFYVTGKDFQAELIKDLTHYLAAHQTNLLDTLLEAMPKKRTRKPRPPYMSGGKLTNVYTDDFIEQGYNQAIQDMLDKLTKL